MERNEAGRKRQMLIAGLLAVTATIGLEGNLVAQSPTVSASPSDAIEAEGPGAFPSADEISEVLGIGVEMRGVENGLSQLWEGSDFDWDALPSAQLAMYVTPPDVDPETMTGVIIDIVRFDSPDDAVRHVDDVVFDGAPPAFETQLTGDFVANMSFVSEDGFGGSVIFVRTGANVVDVTAFTAGASGMEAASEAIVGLVFDRLLADG